MSKVVELIDEAKHQCGIESDYALADAIDVGRQAISDARKGRFVPGPYILLRLAKMANRDIGQVIAEIEAERDQAETPGMASTPYAHCIDGCHCRHISYDDA